MTVIFMDFPQNLSDHMPEKSDPIALNGNQNVLVYHTRQNLLNLRQGALYTFFRAMLAPIFCFSSFSIV